MKNLKIESLKKMMLIEKELGFPNDNLYNDMQDLLDDLQEESVEVKLCDPNNCL